ncbi:hypothetical protein ACFY93_06620 [Streptomyces sp. NPDC008313]|uniref:hypothetical protein n=1 Tax=Streptomyces sp. NPDC008313 TaxID=3364826 RepID=UPI0036EB2F33
MARTTTPLRTAVTGAVLAIEAPSGPQAVAAEKPELRTADSASPSARAFAGKNTAAVSAAATVCGSGYAFRNAVALPSATNRLGTLFVYENGGSGCAIMDNNTSGAKYMYLKICEVGGTNCDTDSGNFTSYAGPNYVNSFACAPVTAKMGTSSSSLYFTYTSERLFPCG